MELEKKEIVLQMSFRSEAKGPAFFEKGNLLTNGIEQGKVTGMLLNSGVWYALI